ncbi:MAG: hypothetical protein LM550_01715 [Candidatus Contendobacter sp.]|jgi:hypothetical protein|nr:hypothetical protein [Gammaproteobacteria bacterium]MCC8992421.1 hypothetical protein [Candidatus Contendobacter sp.]
MDLNSARRHQQAAALGALMLAVTGCRTPVLDVPSPPLELAQVNAAVNRQGPVCPHDYCLDDWPAPNDLDRLEYWDCKAYAVAKADRLTHQHGYAPERLEYVLVEGPPLRVTHAALLVDDRWVLDMGLRCQVCELDRFAAGLRISGRLPIADLPYVRQALRALMPGSLHHPIKQKD